MNETPTVLRPSPDALLAESHRADRGRLKIFLGAAPGVGKTYEMLSAARRKRADGVDVVVGIVETHGRVETAALLEELPVVPRRTLEYRHRNFEELDLDAVLERHPQLVLVDELAHTNIPGSRHAKRYQDVQELLDAGIDVYSTLNVQHLEGYNDLVARITGVEVRETVPDSVLEGAADVELIDLPPDDLLERLRQGKVYVPEQARNAIANFFSRGNLLALRELSFRAAAERLDEELSSYMRAHAIAGPWPTRGGLVVCIDSSVESGGLIRTAKRLADQRHVPWTALFVQTLTRRLTTAQREQLEANLALAEQLGGDTATISGLRVGIEVLEYARQHNAAQVLVGRPRGARWRRLLRGSLADWLVDQATGFEVTVATAEDEQAAEAPRRAREDHWLESAPQYRELAIAAALVAGAAGIAWLLEGWLNVYNLALIFLVAVTFAGGLVSLSASVVASVLSFLLYRFLFTEPRFALGGARPEDATTLATFLVVSIVVGQLAGRLRQQAAEARRNTSRVEVLFDFSRRIATAVDERDLINAAQRGLKELLGTRALMLRALPAGKVEIPADLERADEFRDVDRAAAEWALAHRQPAGAGTATLPAARWHFVPVDTGGQTLAVIAVEGSAASKRFGAEERRLLFALRAQLAAALERFRLQRVSTEARVNREAEGLRSALLASVSHDLRAPLGSLLESLTALRDPQSSAAPAANGARAAGRQVLLETACQEADRLNRFLNNVTDMTRLSYGALTPQLSSVSLSASVTEAIGQLAAVLRPRTVEVRIPADLPPVRADPVLLQRVLVNLLGNAARYSPADSPISVTASQRDDRVRLVIEDRGPGFPPEDRTRLFDLSYQTGQGENAGSGLGLAICKGFIEALGGEIAADNGPDGRGTVMIITLPADRGANPAIKT
ncbi:MAG TPA: sensor histidine kinase KdpD [Steroidobacteraceae bacterium]|nr:sensor histidine kinase KdpD [Steroidobacteraceae bacterium]